MKFRQRHLILPFSLFQMPLWSSAWAQSTSSASSYGSTPGSSAWYGLVTLTLLVVLVAVVLRVFKRMGAAGVTDGGIHVLASKALGPRESVVVVQVEGRYFMVGHTPSQVSLIAELEHFSAPDGPTNGTSTAGLATGFANALTSALRKGPRA